jgi:EmrB/QacA subfamily drug resistance transporter
MPRTNRPLTVVALMLALFMAAMEATVVSTAMPTVARELGGIHLYAWVFTAYMLSSTVSVPIYGKLADLGGRKPIMLIGIALFLCGSMASGMSRTMGQLIAFRAIQGLGAGAMQPMAMTIVGDIFDLEERAKMQAFFGAVWAVAGAVGPFLGGVIVHAWSWHWVFFVNVPFGIGAAILLVIALHEDVDRSRKHKLDVAGALVLAGAIVALLLGSQGTHSALLLSAAAIAVVVLVMIEARAAEPILPLPLLRRRIIAISSVTAALAGAAMFGLISFVPLYVQAVLGLSPTQAGTAIAPMLVAWPIASAFAGRAVSRHGFRPFVVFGLALVAASAIALPIFVRPGLGGAWTARAVSVGFGLGMGLSQTAVLIAVQTSVGWEQRGVATAGNMFFRQIGSTVGVGVLGAVLAAGLRSASGIPSDLVNRMLGPERGGLDPTIFRTLSGTFANALSTMFWGIGALGVAAFFFGLFFPAIRATKPVVEGERAAEAPVPHAGA